jgi:lipoprotein-anchoring transpeptidase ErfK/SrfK
MSQAPPKLAISVMKSEHKLILTETRGTTTTTLLNESIVAGCDDSGTPSGTYRAGKWIKDKTNKTHGPKPWSKDNWGNPYGPYFLPLDNATTGKYTTYGVHGTRGPLFGNFEKPPLPEGVLRFFVGADEAKYLYCSHGCIRLSNKNITRLYELTAQLKYAGVMITVTIK